MISLPTKFEAIYPYQQQAVDEIVDAFGRVDVVVLDGPTGSGKSLIAEVVRQTLTYSNARSGASHQPLAPRSAEDSSGVGVSASYVCTSKMLQEQIAGDFPYFAQVMGRGNYATELYPERYSSWERLSTDDCTKSKQPDGSWGGCLWCSAVARCPYERAKHSALSSPVALLNTAYWLTECNGPGRFSKRPLTIFDEGHLLERELLRHVSVQISARTVGRYKLGLPGKVTKEEAWLKWIDEAIPKLREGLRERVNLSPLDASREAKRIHQLARKLQQVYSGIQSHAWIYTGREGAVEFKPISPVGLGWDKVWRHGRLFLLMSATVVSAEMCAVDYAGQVETVRVPSTFPRESRRVVVMPVAKVSKGHAPGDGPSPVPAAGLDGTDGVSQLSRRVRWIIGQHPDQRILVHSVSYHLSESLAAGVNDARRVYRYGNSESKGTVFTEWQQSRDGVMIGPSLGIGVDLPGDKCRVQVIAKVPWGNLADRTISARLWSPGGRLWYATEAVRDIVQMCGRIVRSKDDWGVTYILDKEFLRLWREYQGLFPAWWKEGVVW